MQEYSMFERLPFRSQAEVIARDGTLLAQRKYKQWHVSLYAVNNTFVELWAGEEVQVYSTFKHSANAATILEPYVEEVDVRDGLSLL